VQSLLLLAVFFFENGKFDLAMAVAVLRFGDGSLGCYLIIQHYSQVSR
jgi:hypothetical protein